MARIKFSADELQYREIIKVLVARLGEVLGPNEIMEVQLDVSTARMNSSSGAYSEEPAHFTNNLLDQYI